MKNDETHSVQGSEEQKVNTTEEQIQDDTVLDASEKPEDCEVDQHSATESASARKHEEELASLKDQLLRKMAEFENYKKRSEREVQDMAKYAVSNFAKDLLSVADNMGRALQSVPTESEDNQVLNNLLTGVKMTESELLKAFEKHKIVKIWPDKEAFDHNFHQAIMEVEDTDADTGTIVEVLQAGYKIHDRLLRPAMVKVAK